MFTLCKTYRLEKPPLILITPVPIHIELFILSSLVFNPIKISEDSHIMQLFSERFVGSKLTQQTMMMHQIECTDITVH